MNVSLVFPAVVLLGQAPPASAELNAEGPRCDFSDRKPLRISHALLGAVVHRVQPDYLSTARNARSAGDVAVRILVDKEGNVVDACTLTGHPLLREAARFAALQWRFRKNFGLRAKQSYDFIEATITFRFRLREGWSRGKVVAGAPPN